MAPIPAPLSGPSQPLVADSTSSPSGVTGAEPGVTANPESDRLVEYDPRFGILALLTVVTVWVAPIAAPALRGWRSGIEEWMEWADAAACLLSQLLAILGVMFVTRALARAFYVNALGTLQKALFFPAGAAVVIMLAMASLMPLDTPLSMSIAGASALAALAAAPAGLRYPETRAAALAVTAIAVGSLIQAVARRLAVQASADALTQLYAAARTLATVALVVVSLATTWSFLWLSRGRARGFWLKLSLYLVVLALVGWGVVAGSLPDGHSWQVLIARATQQVDRHPRGLLAPVVESILVLAPLVAATLGLVMHRDRALRAAVVLALAAGLNTDFAPLAAALVGAGAILAIEAERRRMQDHARGHDARG